MKSMDITIKIRPAKVERQSANGQLFFAMGFKSGFIGTARPCLGVHGCGWV